MENHHSISTKLWLPVLFIQQPKCPATIFFMQLPKSSASPFFIQPPKCPASPFFIQSPKCPASPFFIQSPKCQASTYSFQQSSPKPFSVSVCTTLPSLSNVSSSIQPSGLSVSQHTHEPSQPTDEKDAGASAACGGAQGIGEHCRVWG